MTKHSKISYIKSGIRIIGFGCLPFGHLKGLIAGAALLIIAELFGIAEEWGATY